MSVSIKSTDRFKEFDKSRYSELCLVSIVGRLRSQKRRDHRTGPDERTTPSEDLDWGVDE